MNIDATRVGTEGWKHPGSNAIGSVYGDFCNDAPRANTQGRFPANLICKGIGDVASLFSVVRPATSRSGAGWRSEYVGGEKRTEVQTEVYPDSRSAARFFYAVTGITK